MISIGVTSPKRRVKLLTGIKAGSTGESCAQCEKAPAVLYALNCLEHTGEGKLEEADEGCE